MGDRQDRKETMTYIFTKNRNMVNVRFHTHLLCAIGLFSCLISSATNNQGATDSLQQYVGHWNPDRYGWHGAIDIDMNDGRLRLRMQTEEGEMLFENVSVNESESSLEWSYDDDVKYAKWYIGKWNETNRREIILNVNGIYGTSGVPTEIYEEGFEANHMKQCWKYHAVLVGDKLTISYGCKADYYSSSEELLFTKIKRNVMAINYYNIR